MALDGFVVRSLVHELGSCIGGRIGKIHQPTASDVVLQIRAQGTNWRLLLSASPTYPRLHMTDGQYTNPQEAPMFCMLLRKYFEGAIIEAIEQVDFERIVRIRARQRDELGDMSVKTIVIELMGRHSNIIIVDPASGTIVDGIHHVTPAISSYRVVMPGSAYVAPPDQGKAHPLETDKAQFMQLMRVDAEAGAAESADAALGANAAEQRLVQRFSGVSPLAARELVHRALGADGAAVRREIDPEALWRAFDGVMAQMRRHAYEPNIATTAAGKSYFSVIALTHLAVTTVEPFATPSECLESYFGDKAQRDTVKQRTADLLRFLQNERNKNVKKLVKLRETLDEAKDADRFRIQGELLTAYLHQLKKGDKEAHVVNYYDPEQQTLAIALDPLLTPSENAQRYFKRYTKSRNSLVVVAKQMSETEDEIRYLETLLQQLDDATLADIEEIRAELAEQGYIRKRGGKKDLKKKKTDLPALTRFTSSEGVTIYVGKNNTQNEYVTNRLAEPMDTWLHTKDIPGSHVVIRSQTFGEATLHEAAQLAAYYSQAKMSSRVPVDYTLIRHVRKPSGAKPGFVIYDHQKTLFVTPDEQAIKALKQEAKA